MARPPWSHKGDFGRVLIIGGSVDYTGAPALAGMAALAAGCDLVDIAAPERVAWVINTYSPDLITAKLSGDYLNSGNISALLPLIDGADAVLVGNGLGSRPETIEAIASLMKRIRKPTVLDADALQPNPPAWVVLTPHAGEFCRMFGTMPTTDASSRKKLVEDAARKTGCIILLKGHVDVISDGKKTHENRTGNPDMTVGGTGDTLAGILVSLLAQKIPPFQAACMAAWVNGKAGDLCYKNEGRVLASHLLNYIPQAMKKCKLNA